MGSPWTLASLIKFPEFYCDKKIDKHDVRIYLLPRFADAVSVYNDMRTAYSLNANLLGGPVDSKDLSTPVVDLIYSTLLAKIGESAAKGAFDSSALSAPSTVTHLFTNTKGQNVLTHHVFFEMNFAVKQHFYQWNQLANIHLMGGLGKTVDLPNQKSHELKGRLIFLLWDDFLGELAEMEKNRENRYVEPVWKDSTESRFFTAYFVDTDCTVREATPTSHMSQDDKELVRSPMEENPNKDPEIERRNDARKQWERNKEYLNTQSLAFRMILFNCTPLWKLANRFFD